MFTHIFPNHLDLLLHYDVHALYFHKPHSRPLPYPHRVHSEYNTRRQRGHADSPPRQGRSGRDGATQAGVIYRLFYLPLQLNDIDNSNIHRTAFAYGCGASECPPTTPRETGKLDSRGYITLAKDFPSKTLNRPKTSQTQTKWQPTDHSPHPHPLHALQRGGGDACRQWALVAKPLDPVRLLPAQNATHSQSPAASHPKSHPITFLIFTGPAKDTSESTSCWFPRRAVYSCHPLHGRQEERSVTLTLQSRVYTNVRV